MTALAADWGQWASDCETRGQRPASGEAVPAVTITASTGGRELWSHRVSVATGTVLLADVVPLSTRRNERGGNQ